VSLVIGIADIDRHAKNQIKINFFLDTFKITGKRFGCHDQGNIIDLAIQRLADGFQLVEFKYGETDRALVGRNSPVERCWVGFFQMFATSAFLAEKFARKTFSN